MLAALALLAVSAAAAPTPSPALRIAAPIKVFVDAGEVTRKIVHARLEIPVTAGPLTLLYPKWIPGEHGPTGPIGSLAGLVLRANGKTVAWRRDAEDMYAFHVDVPPGARTLEVSLDFLSSDSPQGFSAGSSESARLAVINWNHVVLYPTGAGARSTIFAAHLTLPAGWRFATALPVARQSGARIEFAPVSLETLVDSPVLSGEILRDIDLSPDGKPPHTLHVAGDSTDAIAIGDGIVAGFRQLVREAHALFGVSHYTQYHFLLALSDRIAHFGLEHHQSSDNRRPERAFLEPGSAALSAGLLPHEFAHSWNGKYRRPADLVTRDFHQPMKTGLLWVYEGLTTYLGEVLTARSGLRTLEQARGALALTAAHLDVARGRTWRSLEDTAVAAQILFGSPPQWRAWRRGVDFYPESQLIWLEADALIRKDSDGRRSLDDFCRAFHGGADGAPEVSPYVLDDIVRALNAVSPRDWRAFFAARIDQTTTRAPLGGIETAGWRLAYSESPSGILTAIEKIDKAVNLSFSLGLLLKDDGTVIDVVPDLPAAKAGVGPGMKIVAVNGRRFSPDVVRSAVKTTKTTPDVELLVENGEMFRSHKLVYRGGNRYPVLERDSTRPDLLTAILSARSPAPPP